jgi:acyl carrier protein
MNRLEMLNALKADVDVLAKADEATVLGALPGWDSLAILLVVSHCEHVHDLEVRGPQVRACQTVGDLLDLIESLS